MSTAIAEQAPDATASRPRNVYDCLVAVAGEIAQQGIAKTRSNDQQHYKFRGIDEVMNALSPLLAKHKLLILPRVLAREVTERQTQKGSVLFYVVVECEFDFVSAEDGSKHTVKTYGEAMDSADKATNKAMSAAYKYAAFQTFCIPTEGDNDADAHTHDVASRAPAPRRPAFTPVPGEREQPSVPNGGASGMPLPTEDGLPPGYHYISEYRYDRGWHEIVVRGLDAKGGAMKLSTKLGLVGESARRAFEHQRAVRVEWKPKPNGTPGEAYLSAVHELPDELPEIQLRGDEHRQSVTLDQVPF